MNKKLRLLSVAVALAFAGAVHAQTAVVQSVNNLFNKGATYSASGTETLAATPTDVFVIEGSATKTIYVRSFEVSCVKTTAGQAVVNLIKRSVANTGDSIAVTPVPLDGNDIASVAAVRYYSVNPSALGSAVGTVSRKYMTFPAPATAGWGSLIEQWLWGTTMDRYLTLRGAAQSLAINMGGATLTGAVCTYNATWIER
jgi:hypothetical protein